MIAATIAALLCAAAEAPPPPELPAPLAAAAVARPGKKKGKPPMAGVVNVNRASEAELRLLPGIGKRRAQLIVERREKKPFATVDEIGRIPGMRSLVQRLHGHLSVQGDTTIHPARP